MLAVPERVVHVRLAVRSVRFVRTGIELMKVKKQIEQNFEVILSDLQS